MECFQKMGVAKYLKRGKGKNILFISSNNVLKKAHLATFIFYMTLVQIMDSIHILYSVPFSNLVETAWEIIIALKKITKYQTTFCSYFCKDILGLGFVAIQNSKSVFYGF